MPSDKLEFYTRQFVDAMSPANFPWSNPEAIKLAAETDGESVNRGLSNLAADLDKGLISMTDETAFEVGRNLAITPGAVVYENDFMQLIQYQPPTADRARATAGDGAALHQQVLHPRPAAGKLLRPLCRRAGHTVFMVSWRNMPPEMGQRDLGRLPRSTA